MFCKKCGNPMNDDEKFCPKCGTPVDGAPAETAAAGSTPNARAAAPVTAKTKIGLSVGVVAAIAYFFGLLGNVGLLACLVLVGYVFLCESDAFLKKSAVKALAIGLCFIAVSVTLQLIPDFLGFIDDFLDIFNSGLAYGTVRDIFTAIQDVLDIAEKVLYLLLGFLAVFGKTLPVPVLDGLLDKNIK